MEKYYHVGQLFLPQHITTHKGLCLLAQVDTGVIKLIHLYTGNRMYNDALPGVHHAKRVSKAIFHKTYGDEWTLVEAKSELELAILLVRQT